MLKRMMTTAAMLLAVVSVSRADAGAEYDRAVAAYQDGNFAEAIKILQSPAKEGFVEAQYMLGLMYHRGRGTEVDPTKAVQWYAKAADQNHPGALCNLGMILHAGLANGDNVVKPDKEQAMGYLRRSAYLENVPAYVAYGAAMINDGKTEATFAEGVAFMRIAADAGDEVAVQNIKSLKVTPEQSQAADAKRKEIEANIKKIREIRAAEANQPRPASNGPKKNPLDD